MCGGGTTTKATPPPAANAVAVERTEPDRLTEVTGQGESQTAGGATMLTGSSASTNPRKNISKI